MPERTPSGRRQWLLWLAGTAFYSGYAWALPFGFWDEGYLYYVATAVAQGQVPFRDLHLQSYMPGLFDAFSGPMALGSGSVLIPRLAMVPWLAVTPVLMLRCAWRLASPPLAWAVALTVLLVPGPWTKFYVAGLSLLILEAVLDVAEQPGRKAALRAGAAVGLSLGLRIDVGIAGAALLLLAVAFGPRDRIARAMDAGAGFALGWAPFLLLLLARGVLLDHLRQLAGFAPDMLWRMRAGQQLAPPPAPWEAGMSAHGLLFYGSLAIPAALTAATALRWSCMDERRSRLLLLAWALLNIPQYAWERPDVPHFTQRAFCFLLPLAVVIHDAWRARAAGAAWRQRAALATLAAGVAFFATYVIRAVARGEGGSAGALWHPRTEVRLSNGVSYWMAPGAPPPEMLERVLARTRPGEPVATLPYCPGINFLTGRPLPGRYVFLIPHVVTSQEVERRYISELERARYAVYLPSQSMDQTVQGRLPGYAPLVAARLREDFSTELETGGVVLLRRTTDAAARLARR